MKIDLIEQLAIVARDASAEFQAVLVAVCLTGLAVCGFVMFFEKCGPFLHKVYHDFLHLDGIGRVVVVVCFSMATLYAGWKRVESPGADEGISLEGVYYYATNDTTYVNVKFFGNGITTSTPVAVRLTQTNDWTVLTKIDPTVVYDLATNVLSFAVAEDLKNFKYWWVGEDRPSIIVETTGISIYHFYATSTSVSVSFTCDDPSATTFELQTRIQGTQEWTTVSTVERGDIMGFEYSGFTIDKTREWRVRSEYTQGDN